MAYGRLDVFWPDGLFKTYLLTDPTISIGRSPGNSIPLETDTLSRYHASLTHKDGEVQLPISTRPTARLSMACG